MRGSGRRDNRVDGNARTLREPVDQSAISRIRIAASPRKPISVLLSNSDGDAAGGFRCSAAISPATRATPAPGSEGGPTWTFRVRHLSALPATRARLCGCYVHPRRDDRLRSGAGARKLLKRHPGERGCDELPLHCSEAYYPRARFVDDSDGTAQIAAKVPLGRLGRPEEIGELISFLASGKAPFVAGQVIDFTGGWP